MNDSWICIDFGTCNTAAAIVTNGKPHLVSNGYVKFFPTIACVMDSGEIQVCQDAEMLRQSMPENFKQEFKLHISEPLDLNGAEYKDIVRELLAYVKGYAEIENNNNVIENVLITIPAIYTEDDRRTDVMRCAAIAAGFQNVEFMYEPEAAARHYASIMGLNKTGISLVYDLGGGTFDPALLDMRNANNIKLIGSEHGVKCGGQFFDSALYKYASDEFRKQDVPLERLHRLEDHAVCKRIKEMLSIKNSASMKFSNGKNLKIERNVFEGLIKDKIYLTLEACDSLLHTTDIEWNEINQVLLVGGSTSIPLIGQMLQQHAISQNASKVKIVSNTSGKNGEYDRFYATCLGGISSKIAPPPPPLEPIARMFVNGKYLQLKEGINSFGRNIDMDFSFPDDRYMSRKHFIINVTKDANNHWNYSITTCSETKATILNNIEALDIENNPISRRTAELMDGWNITAGNTVFKFIKLLNE